MTKEQFLSLASEDYDQWASSQKGQQDPHEYERSFDDLMAKFSQRLFQVSVGEVPSDRRKKNDTKSVWQD
jgi:hypothetical protein